MDDVTCGACGEEEFAICAECGALACMTCGCTCFDESPDTSGHRSVDLGDGYWAHLTMSPDSSPEAVEAVTELMRLAKNSMQEGRESLTTEPAPPAGDIVQTALDWSLRNEFEWPDETYLSGHWDEHMQKISGHILSALASATEAEVTQLLYEYGDAYLEEASYAECGSGEDMQAAIDRKESAGQEIKALIAARRVGMRVLINRDEWNEALGHLIGTTAEDAKSPQAGNPYVDGDSGYLFGRALENISALVDPFLTPVTTTTCSACGGTGDSLSHDSEGYVVEHHCSSCNGKGVVPVTPEDARRT